MSKEHYSAKFPDAAYAFGRLHLYVYAKFDFSTYPLVNGGYQRYKMCASLGDRPPIIFFSFFRSFLVSGRVEKWFLVKIRIFYICVPLESEKIDENYPSHLRPMLKSRLATVSCLLHHRIIEGKNTTSSKVRNWITVGAYERELSSPTSLRLNNWISCFS